MIHATVKPEILEWALVRSGDRAGLEKKFANLADWLRGAASPTLRQLEEFATASRVPVGFLFLNEPPVETLPIADLRTFAGRGVRRPSPDLLDTLYMCQRRQGWYQEYAEEVGEDPKDFVGSVTVKSQPDAVAAQIAAALGFAVGDRRGCPTWTDALRLFIEHVEAAGILVMVSGVVGANNHRKLDPHEFRGFALADKLAPLVFVNGADTKAAQIFTLAHELAHVWLGESALSNAGLDPNAGKGAEVWCNAVAAELLVPLADLRTELRGEQDIVACVARLARVFKVSTLVILRRLLDAGFIGRDRFQHEYTAEVGRLTACAKGGGGDFYLTQSARLSRRFARAVVASTLEGQTLYRDAFQMLGVKKEQTFRELGRSLGVIS